MSRRRRRNTSDQRHLAADALGPVYFHLYDALPSVSDDFQIPHASSYETDWGQKTITVSGSPANAGPLGDTDGRAKDLDGSDDDYSVPDAADLDAAADEDLAVVVTVEGSSISSAETVIEKWDGTVGWRLRQQPDGTVDFIADDNSSEDRAQSTTTIDDGNAHTIVGTIDRDGNAVNIIVDGTQEGSVTNNAGSVANASTVNVGASSFSGTVGVWSVGKTWVAEEVGAYLHDILTQDRTLYADALNVWTYGTPRQGFSRKKPSWIDDDYWSDTDFFWTPERTIHLSDGQSPAQVPDYSGQNFFSQRDDTDKAVARGDTEVGHPLDRLEFGSSSYYTSDAFPDAPDSITVLFVGVQKTSNTNGIFGHRDTDADPTVSCWIDQQEGIRVSLGKGGNNAATSATCNPTNVTVGAVRWDGLNTSSQSVKVWADDGTAVTTGSNSVSNSSGYSVATETFGALESDGTFTNSKDLYFFRRIDAAPSDAEIESMISTLANRYQ